METDRPLLPARVQETVEIPRPRPILGAAAVNTPAPLVELPSKTIPNPIPKPAIEPALTIVSTPAAIASAISAKPSNACDWASVQAAAAGERRQLKMVVEEASLIEFKEGRVELRVAPDLMTAAMGVQEDIKQLITRTWGRSVRLEFATGSTAAPLRDVPESTGATPSGPVPEAGPSLTVANAAENPLIAKAMELLGAKVVGVYVRQK